jgi:formate/nitrite transporter FocA (FNT family)
VPGVAGPETRRAQAAQEQTDDGAAPGLRGAEHRQVERRAAPRAAVVLETIRREGVDELERPTSALAWSGLAAGLSMGFSLVTEGLLRAGLTDAPWRPLVSRLGYSVGFLIVVLGRQQLFTENTLTPILPLLARRNLATLLQVLRLWGVVLLANLFGALAFAWVLGRTDVFAPEVQRAFAEISAEALRGDVATTFLRAIFAGWLIALMVWLLPFAETARVGVIIIITYVVGLGGFSHIIVGSVETSYAVVTGAAAWPRVLGGFVLPTLAGNILGGVALVAALNYAQVVSGGAADA